MKKINDSINFNKKKLEVTINFTNITFDLKKY